LLVTPLPAYQYLCYPFHYPGILSELQRFANHEKVNIMAWLLGGKHFGGYTYEHWFDDDTTPGAGEDSDAKPRATEPPASAGKEDTGKAEGESSPHGGGKDS
jgi:hypothetical protein